MIGGESIGGPKDPLRHIGMKGELDQDPITGRRGALPGIVAGEIDGMEEDLPVTEARETRGKEGEGRCRDIREEGRAINRIPAIGTGTSQRLRRPS